MTDAVTVRAAHVLAESIRRFAAKNTNAVLSVLDEPDRIVTERKYPESGLRFRGDALRAFYHVHDAPGKHGDEHGHFHVFVRVGTGDDPQQDWAHLAALSLDRYGQPLQWFAVNHWVTAGRWLDAEALMKALSTIELNERDEPVQSWLAAMVILFRSDLQLLLAQRDRSLTGIKAKTDATNILDDHSIYAVGASAIDLLNVLGRVLGVQIDSTVQFESEGK